MNQRTLQMIITKMESFCFSQYYYTMDQLYFFLFSNKTNEHDRNFPIILKKDHKTTLPDYNIENVMTTMINLKKGNIISKEEYRTNTKGFMKKYKNLLN